MPVWQAEALRLLPVRPSVRSFVRPFVSLLYQTCKHDILKSNQPNQCVIKLLICTEVD